MSSQDNAVLLQSTQKAANRRTEYRVPEVINEYAKNYKSSVQTVKLENSDFQHTEQNKIYNDNMYKNMPSLINDVSNMNNINSNNYSNNNYNNDRNNDNRNINRYNNFNNGERNQYVKFEDEVKKQENIFDNHILPVLMNMFGPTIQSTIKMTLSNTPIDNKIKLKEYETHTHNLKKFNGDYEIAPQWFRELSTIVVRYRMDRARVNLLLYSKLEGQAQSWYDSRHTELAHLDEEKAVPKLLSLFKNQYLGITQQLFFDHKIRAFIKVTNFL